MARWHNIRVRGDLYEMLFHRATSDRRSVAQMTDVLLTQALQEPEPEIDLSEKIDLLQPSEGFKWNGRGRETFPRPTEGQTTVDEMLASCPQCAGELEPFNFSEVGEEDAPTVRCVDCLWVREPEQ